MPKKLLFFFSRPTTKATTINPLIFSNVSLSLPSFLLSFFSSANLRFVQSLYQSVFLSHFVSNKIFQNLFLQTVKLKKGIKNFPCLCRYLAIYFFFHHSFLGFVMNTSSFNFCPLCQNTVNYFFFFLHILFCSDCFLQSFPIFFVQTLKKISLFLSSLFFSFLT